MGAINKILGTVGGVLGLAVLAGGVAMAVPESRNWILDEVAKSSNAYKTQVKENDELRLEISELKTDIANKQSEVTTLTEQKVVLLNAVTKIDNEINTTTDKTTLDNLQEKKTAILNQVDDLNGQIAEKQAQIDSLQARVEELENSVQINVTNVGETNCWAGLITDELANLLENATDEELQNYVSDQDTVWKNTFNIGSSSGFEQSSNLSFKILKNLNGCAIYQNSSREIEFNCNYGNYNGRELLSNHGYFNSDDEGATFKREFTNIELNLTYKLEDGTVIDINSYDDKTTLKSYRCENVNVTYDENYKITGFTGDIVILSMVEPTLITGSELRNVIGTDVTAVTFDQYTDSENQTYVVDGVNVIDGVAPLNVSNVDNEYSVKLYKVDNKAYILSKDKIVANSDMSFAFYQFDSLTNLNLSNLDTSNVTNMASMFRDCSSLNSLDLSNFDTSNVTNMSQMFDCCSSLTSLDVSSFNTSNVIDMNNMFNVCSSLNSLDLSNFDTSNVTNMEYMFSSCTGLITLDISNFDTSNVTNMEYMFFSCTGLITLDISNFDTSNVTNMSLMFNYCSSLTSLDVSSFNTSNVTNMNGMFNSCTGLITLDISNFDTNNVTDMNAMFNYCPSLTTIYVGENWNVDNVTSSDNMFFSCSSLPNFDENVLDKTNAYVGGYLTSKTQSAEI